MGKTTDRILWCAAALSALLGSAPSIAHEADLCDSEAHNWRRASRVEVYSWDSIVLEGSAIPLSQIQERLAQSSTSVRGTVVITGGEVPDQRLLTVLDHLTDAGIEVWGIETPAGQPVSSTAYVLAGSRAVVGGVGMSLREAGECIRASARPGDGLHVLSTPGSAFGDGNRLIQVAIDAGLIPTFRGNVTEDVTRGGVLNEAASADRLLQAAEYYRGMDPGMAARHLVHASFMSDTTVAALLEILPDDQSEEIYKRLPPETALRITDLRR